MAKKVNIVYIVGRGSVWQNNELRFSLRSIARFGKNIGRVIIVGEMPPFVNPKTVTHVPFGDETDCKHYNIMMKINAAIDKLKLTEPFLISSDDHFLTTDADFAKYPIISKGVLDAEDNSKGEYFRSLNQTRKWLKDHGMTIYKTNPHYNTWIDPKTFKELLPALKEAYRSTCPDGLEINCVMGNALIAKGWHFETWKDCKVQEPHPLPWWEERFKARPAMSIGDAALTRYFAKFLLDTFPNQSCYELSGVTLQRLFNPYA